MDILGCPLAMRPELDLSNHHHPLQHHRHHHHHCHHVGRWLSTWNKADPIVDMSCYAGISPPWETFIAFDFNSRLTSGQCNSHCKENRPEKKQDHQICRKHWRPNGTEQRKQKLKKGSKKKMRRELVRSSLANSNFAMNLTSLKRISCRNVFRWDTISSTSLIQSSQKYEFFISLSF